MSTTFPEWGKGWLANEGIAPGTPFLLSPVFEYDIELNAYFTNELAPSAPKTQEASAGLGRVFDVSVAIARWTVLAGRD